MRDRSASLLRFVSASLAVTAAQNERGMVTSTLQSLFGSTVARVIQWHQRSRVAKLGFERKQLTMPSGEQVGYLEKPATVPATGDDANLPTLVVLHGLTTDPTALVYPCGKNLNLPSGVRCLVPELLGHGSRIAHAKTSGKIGFSLEEYAQDVDAVLDAIGIAQDERIDIMGYSLGGAATLKLAELTDARRFNRAILAAPPVVLGIGPSEEYRQGKGFTYAFETAVEATAMAQLVGADPATAEMVGPVLANLRRLQHGAEDTIGIRDYWSRLCASIAGRPGDQPQSFRPSSPPEDVDDVPEDLPILEGAKALSRAGVPTLVVHGAADEVCHVSGARALVRALGQTTALCEYEEIAGCGHFFHPANPKALFLKSASRAAASFLGFR